MTDAIAALADIALQLKDHPEVNQGNSKVHYCYHHAMSTLNSILDEKASMYGGVSNPRMGSDPAVIQVRAALSKLQS